MCPKNFPLTAFLQSSAKKARWAAMCPWATGHRPSALHRVALGLCWHGPCAGVTPSLGRTCATCPSSVVRSVRLVHDVNSVSGNSADGTWQKCQLLICLFRVGRAAGVGLSDDARTAPRGESAGMRMKWNRRKECLPKDLCSEA